MSRALGPKMPKLLDLPHELVLSILQNTELPELYSAILSHSTFNNIWKSHTSTISKAVLSNSIECPPEAMHLAHAASSERPIDFAEAVERHKRIVSAAKCVSDMYDAYLHDVDAYLHDALAYPRLQLLCPETRRACIRAFYWLWSAVLTSQYKPFKAAKPMARLPPRAMLTLCEIFLWIPVQAYACVYSPIAKARRIYPPLSSRPRVAQHRRWQICCQRLWYDTDVKAARQEVWNDILQTDADEPRIFGEQKQELASFLARVRSSLDAQSGFPD